VVVPCIPPLEEYHLRKHYEHPTGEYSNHTRVSTRLLFLDAFSNWIFFYLPFFFWVREVCCVFWGVWVFQGLDLCWVYVESLFSCGNEFSSVIGLLTILDYYKNNKKMPR